MRYIRIFIISIISIVVIFGILFGLMVWGDTLPAVSISEGAAVEQKFKDALLGDGVMELDEADINEVAGMALSGGGIKGIYIKIEDSRMKISAVVEKLGIGFFVRSTVNAYMEDKDIMLDVEGVTIGKLPIPVGVASGIIKGMLPPGTRSVDGNSFNMGSRFLMFDIKDVLLEGNTIKIELLKETPVLTIDNSGKVVVSEGNDDQTGSDDIKEAETTSEDNGSLPPTGSEDSPKSQEKPAPESDEPGQQSQDDQAGEGGTDEPQYDEETMRKIEALKATNAQMYNVMGQVKSPEGKSWVGWVISVNTSMIQNPDGDFKSQISGAKAAYKSLPVKVRSEIKGAALRNMDTSAVIFLVSAYGI